MSHQFSSYSGRNSLQILPSEEPAMDTETSPSADGAQENVQLKTKSDETTHVETPAKHGGNVPPENGSNGDIDMEVLDDDKTDLVPESTSNEQRTEE